MRYEINNPSSDKSNNSKPKHAQNGNEPRATEKLKRRDRIP
jgi:hypothetical protein